MSLINRTAVRSYLLKYARDTRSHLGFTQVSEEALQEIESMVRHFLSESVRRHPTKGKTFKELVPWKPKSLK